MILGLCCLLVYNANGRAISAGDTLPARYLPFAIWGYQTLTLDPVASLTTQGRLPRDPRQPQPNAAFWTLKAPTGHLVSLYPVVLSVLIAPLYLPAAGYLHLRGWTDERVDRVARLMEKLTASCLAALSVSLLYLLLRRRAAPPIALMLTAAYAFGTTTWVISSQALWQHGMAQVLLVGLMLILTAPCTAPRALAAGLLCGLIAGNRPPDAVLAAALGAYGLYWAHRRAALLVVAASVPAALVLLYNLTIVGAIGGGYGLVSRRSFFDLDAASGLAGLLFSPTRGLLVFSPFFVFLALAWRHWAHDADARRLTLAVAAGVVVQVLAYSIVDWRGGMSWGPRFMTDLLPLLVWILVPAVAALGRVGRVYFVTAVAVAISIEAIGAFTYTDLTDQPIFAARNGPDRMRAAWDWRNAPFIAAPRQGLAPPELALLARRALLAQLPPAAGGDLDASFRTAAARVREHQQEPGYWLTAFTHATRFEHPAAEMNVYLTALMVDLLDPVSASSGLGDSVQRARRHLAAQIEAGGLVRYHGRPDGPGIGTLGCAITPDTDDTALVWRIAPGPDRRLLDAALRTVDAYRRDDGLYRTWLSPREGYQCLDPGQDPNPADVAIQIHLLQLLAAEQPAAGRALCEALRGRIDDTRIWVYYQRSPLVPILRLPALERAGCPVSLPESRMQTTVPGQEIWISVARRLAGKAPGPAPPGTVEVQALLRELATDDFARLRQSPPFLYHNDLTATVPRYYWSEDVGYALWLRLAHDHAHIGHPRPGA